MGYSPWGHKESDVTEKISTHAQVFISLEFMPESTVVGLCGKCTLSFIKNCQTVFQCNNTTFTLLSQYMRNPVFPHAHQNLILLVVFIILAILIGVWQHLIMVLICISLMANDVEHLFMFS